MHDSNLGKYNIAVYFGKINLDYAEYVRSKFEKFLNKSLEIYDGNESSVKVNIASKKVYLHFKGFLNFNQKLKHSTVEIKNLEKLPLNFKLGILKGLIDTDGCVSKEKSTGRYKVQFFTTSKRLNSQFGQLIKSLGFECGDYSIPSHIKLNPVGKSYIAKEYYSTYLLKKDVLPLINLVKPYKTKKWGL